MRSAIKVTWGPELYAPIRFHTFTVGPYELYVAPNEGETDEQAFERGYKFLATMGQRAFNSQLKLFVNRCRVAGLTVRQQRAASNDEG